MGWRTSTGHPVRATPSPEKSKECSVLFRQLLLNVTELLKNDELQNVLCFGIASDAAVVKSNSETVQACAPTVTQSECLRNIMKDMTHYDAVFQSYIRSSLRSPDQEIQLLSPTLEIIQKLKTNCSLMSDGENDASEENAVQKWDENTFNNRQEMCKMMRGFYTRIITINRAMGYISSGDHKK
ncbi:uncharacterized protein V6R79_000104 [Siganus canaliculatus]